VSSDTLLLYFFSFLGLRQKDAEHLQRLSARELRGGDAPQASVGVRVLGNRHAEGKGNPGGHFRYYGHTPQASPTAGCRLGGGGFKRTLQNIFE